MNDDALETYKHASDVRTTALPYHGWDTLFLFFTFGPISCIKYILNKITAKSVSYVSHQLVALYESIGSKATRAGIN